jgi:signal transduction histidine kinase
VTPADTADAWDGGEGRWDAYFAVVLIGTLAVAEAIGSVSVAARVVGSAALLAMVPWYLFVGRRTMYSRFDGLYPRWQGTLYLIGLAPLLAVAEVCSSSETFILLALCPMCFMAVAYWRAIAAVVVFNLLAVPVAVARGYNAAGIETTLGIAVLGMTFSVAFGTWIIQIIKQSEERAELIAQLEQTRAELALANREAGVLAERDRLAGEIHDTIAQGFTSIVMLVQAVQAMIESADLGLARTQLKLIDQTARENLAEARTLVADLTPAPLTSATLADALARLTERAGQELGIAADFAVSGSSPDLGTRKEVVLLRVCQEALANVRKHAKASTVRVRLELGESCARLIVADDGVGFDTGLASGGYGLRGMQARAAEVGGSLQVASAPGLGTTVRAEVA